MFEVGARCKDCGVALNSSVNTSMTCLTRLIVDVERCDACKPEVEAQKELGLILDELHNIHGTPLQRVQSLVEKNETLKEENEQYEEEFNGIRVDLGLSLHADIRDEIEALIELKARLEDNLPGIIRELQIAASTLKELLP